MDYCSVSLWFMGPALGGSTVTPGVYRYMTINAVTFRGGFNGVSACAGILYLVKCAVNL